MDYKRSCTYPHKQTPSLGQTDSASRRKSAQVSVRAFDLRSGLRFIWRPTRWFAWTCDNLGKLWSNSRTQVVASFSPFRHPTQVDTSSGTRLAWACEPICKSVCLPPPQIRTQVLVLQLTSTCIYLHQHAIPFCQGFRLFFFSLL